MPLETETVATPGAFVMGSGIHQRVDTLGLRPLGPEIYFAPSYSCVLTDREQPWRYPYTTTVVRPFEEALG